MKLAAVSALSAYLCWGAFGLYFKALDQIPPLEILSHRIIWSVLFLFILLVWMKKLPEALVILSSVKKTAIFAFSAFLISTNWFFYIYAVVSGQALQGSMGYFIMPLVAVLFGAVVFKERYNKTQALAIGLALSGVFIQIVLYGDIPWIALILALSFGSYGVVRKLAPADSMVGLFIETLLMAPIALLAIIYWGQAGELSFLTSSASMQALLVMAGPVTALPLLLFAYGARRLPYSTVGLLQYINPTCQFLLAIYIFKEEFTTSNLVTFGFIWTALAVYSYNIYVQSRKKKLSNS